MWSDSCSLRPGIHTCNKVEFNTVDFDEQSRPCRLFNSVSPWNAWPATGRSALQTCGHVRSSRRRWRWDQCRPRSAAPTFGSRVVLAGASTPAWCPVYRLHECPQPGIVLSGLVSLPVVAARDQKWRVASDKSRLLSLLRQFGLWLRRYCCLLCSICVLVFDTKWNWRL